MHFNLARIKGPKSVSSRIRKFPWQAWIALNFNTSRSPLRKKTSGSLLEHPAITAKRIRPQPQGTTNLLSIFNFWKRETSSICSWEGSKVDNNSSKPFRFTWMIWKCRKTASSFSRAPPGFLPGCEELDESHSVFQNRYSVEGVRHSLEKFHLHCTMNPIVLMKSWLEFQSFVIANISHANCFLPTFPSIPRHSNQVSDLKGRRTTSSLLPPMPGTVPHQSSPPRSSRWSFGLWKELSPPGQFLNVPQEIPQVFQGIPKAG